MCWLISCGHSETHPDISSIPSPPQNPMSAEGVSLGKQLFSDSLLSTDGHSSCATCHVEKLGFSSPRKRPVAGQKDRETQPLYNLAWSASLFWDGREKNLETLVIKPIQARHEMNSKLTQVVGRLNKSSTYRTQFQKVFGSDSIYTALVARALSQYIRSLIRFEPDSTQLNVIENEGRLLFNQHCRSCHVGKTTSDFAMRKSVLQAMGADSGLFHITRNREHIWFFRTPSLAAVGATTPYMHNGQFQSLREVIIRYSQVLKQPQLASPQNQNALLAYLKRL